MEIIGAGELLTELNYWYDKRVESFISDGEYLMFTEDFILNDFYKSFNEWVKVGELSPIGDKVVSRCVSSEFLYGKIKNAFPNAYLNIGNYAYKEIKSSQVSNIYNENVEILKRYGLYTWNTYHDCDNKSLEFTTAAMRRNSFAIGEMWYMAGARAEDGTGGGHSVNLILTNEGLEPFEPQTGEFLYLSHEEISSCWYIQFCSGYLPIEYYTHAQRIHAKSKIGGLNAEGVAVGLLFTHGGSEYIIAYYSDKFHIINAGSGMEVPEDKVVDIMEETKCVRF